MKPVIDRPEVDTLPKPKTLYEEYRGASKYFVDSTGLKTLWFIPGLLAAHSEPLNNMLFGDYNEKDKVAVPLPDDEFEGMEHTLLMWVPIPPEDVIPLSETNMEFIFPIAKKYLMDHIVTKCHSILQEKAYKGNDLNLALVGLVVGIKCKESEMVKDYLQLCIWRKDLLNELEKRELIIPKSVQELIEKSASCDLLPWNVNWLYVYYCSEGYHYLDKCCNHCFQRRSHPHHCISCTRMICDECKDHKNPLLLCLQSNGVLTRDDRKPCADCGDKKTNHYYGFRKKCMKCFEFFCGNRSCFLKHVDECSIDAAVITKCLVESCLIVENEYNETDWFN